MQLTDEQCRNLVNQLLDDRLVYFINQPSTLQKYHYIHGKLVFRGKKYKYKDGYRHIYYLNGRKSMYPSVVPDDILGVYDKQ